MRVAVTLVVACLALGGCATQVARAPVVPPLPAETRPLPPVSAQTLVWQPGDWAFLDGSYRYEPGRYVTEAGHGTAWQFAHWVLVQGHYVWVPGAWS